MAGWRDGDIVRMGFIPPSSPPGPLHRFSLHTDAAGFRNRSIDERVEVAALGDSFTDAMTMAAEAAWPAQLEQTLGVPVRNYGTAGFGPQQELLVLKDFVVPRRPRTVVLAFFAGNDIFDAEAFDAFQRSGGTVRRATPGWRVKDIVSRADRWFVVEAETGTMKLNVSQVDLAKLAAEVTAVYEDTAEDAGVALSVRAPEHLTVTADRDRLRQALANLVDNAIKYTPSGGRVEVTAGQTAGTVSISVRDTGAGIAEHEIPRIWDRLYRGDQSRATRGLGLGLNLVRASVEAQGGTVAVESQPGRGSTFTITLPASPNITDL